MSYSRWFNSTWYTYWSASSPETNYKLPTRKLKRQQIFEICDLPSFRFTYGELEDNQMRGIISKVKRYYNRPHNGQMFKEWKDGVPVYYETIYPAKKPTDDELRELMEYIRKWQIDVDKRFEFWTFVKYEWYAPAKRQVKSFFRSLIKRI